MYSPAEKPNEIHAQGSLPYPPQNALYICKSAADPHVSRVRGGANLYRHLGFAKIYKIKEMTNFGKRVLGAPLDKNDPISEW